MEYWVVDSIDKEVTIFTKDEEFDYSFDEKITSQKFEKLIVDLSKASVR